MRKLALVLTLVVYIISISSADISYSMYEMPVAIKSPEELANWLHNEFTYIFKIPDYEQTPEETISRRSGDCEDFANLSHKILNYLGITNDIIIIKFRQINIMHSICIFKQGAAYSFIANREIVRTTGRSIDEAITETFPDWDKLTYMTANGNLGRTVYRGCTGGAGASTLSIASLYGSLLSPENRDIGMIKFMLESRLSALMKSGMLFSATTLTTILKDTVEFHVRFLFDKTQLTPGGFRVPCIAEDAYGTRTYYALFSIRAAWEGFTMAVYPESDWKRVNQFNNVIPRLIT